MDRFTIKNKKGLEIVGTLLLQSDPKGLAFTVHGLGGFKEQPHIMTLVNTLFENGYTVVNFDASNSIGESEGKYENATMQDHYEDLIDVINWAKSQQWYKEPFVMAGHSLGGYAVARYAEEHPKEIKGVFPYALVVSGDLSYKAAEMEDKGKLLNWQQTGWQERESTSKPGTKLRIPWSHMLERLKHDVRPQAGNLTMPVLLVVGSEDKSCTYGSQHLFYDLIPGDKEIHIVPGAPHTFRDPNHLAELKAVFDRWLKRIK